MDNFIVKKVNDDNSYLIHYGVKGMKWGVRRRGENGSGLTQKKKNSVKDESDKKKGLSSKQKKALKIGAAVVGTALVAYGGYKINKLVREKNQSIRIKEGKAKCDRMVKKLDRMRTNDLLNGSTATEKWLNPRSYKRNGFQYNNNGRTVTIAREYRNTNSTLKPEQYRNIEKRMVEKTMDDAFNKAKNDSFITAVKNIRNDYKRNKR